MADAKTPDEKKAAEGKVFNADEAVAAAEAAEAKLSPAPMGGMSEAPMGGGGGGMGGPGDDGAPPEEVKDDRPIEERLADKDWKCRKKAWAEVAGLFKAAKG